MKNLVLVSGLLLAFCNVGVAQNAQTKSELNHSLKSSSVQTISTPVATSAKAVAILPGAGASEVRNRNMDLGERQVKVIEAEVQEHKQSAIPAKAVDMNGKTVHRRPE